MIMINLNTDGGAKGPKHYNVCQKWSMVKFRKKRKESVLAPMGYNLTCRAVPAL